MDEEYNAIASNESYRVITENILSDIGKFKNGIIEQSSMNKAMFFNIFNMVKVLSQKEMAEKEKTFDVFIPGCKLEQDNNEQTKEIQFDHESESYSAMNYLDNNNKTCEIFDENHLCPFSKIDKSFLNEEPEINMSNIPISLVPKNTFAEGFPENQSMIIPYDDEPAFRSICISKPIIKPHPQSKLSHLSFVQKLNKKIDIGFSFETDINNQLSTSTAVTLETDDLKGNIRFKDKRPSILSTNSITPSLEIDAEYMKHVHPRTRQYYLTNMNEYYLACMYKLYSRMKDQSKGGLLLWNETDQFLFINTFKSFLLSIGFGIKKFYEDALRSLIYQKDNFTFEEFLKFFHQLLKYKEKQSIFKFKLLLYIIQTNDKEDYVMEDDVKNYFIMIKKKIVYEHITDCIEKQLIHKYHLLYPKSDPNKFSIKRLSMVLETFFITQ